MTRLLCGVLLAFIVAAAGRIGANLIGTLVLGLQRTPVSPILVAIALGVAIRALSPAVHRFEPGYQACLTWILRAGIVLLGLRLSLVAAGSIGLQALPIVLICIVVALIAVRLLSHAFGLSSRLGTLIAAGTSICGCTAIVATAPVIRADKQEMAYAIGCVTLFGLLAMFVNPLIAHALFEAEPQKAGIFLGTSIHETAQVAGAGLMYAQYYPAVDVLESATVTKLVRNLCMLLVIPVLSLAYSRAMPRGALQSRITELPWFVFGFIGLCALRTAGDLGEQPFGILDRATWEVWMRTAAIASEWCLTVAMAAVGLSTDLAALRRLGIRPLLLAFMAASLVGVVAAALLQVL